MCADLVVIRIPNLAIPLPLIPARPVNVRKFAPFASSVRGIDGQVMQRNASRGSRAHLWPELLFEAAFEMG